MPKMCQSSLFLFINIFTKKFLCEFFLFIIFFSLMQNYLTTFISSQANNGSTILVGTRQILPFCTITGSWVLFKVLLNHTLVLLNTLFGLFTKMIFNLFIKVFLFIWKTKLQGSANYTFKLTFIFRIL